MQQGNEDAAKTLVEDLQAHNPFPDRQILFQRELRLAGDHSGDLLIGSVSLNRQGVLQGNRLVAARFERRKSAPENCPCKIIELVADPPGFLRRVVGAAPQEWRLVTYGSSGQRLLQRFNRMPSYEDVREEAMAVLDGTIDECRVLKQSQLNSFVSFNNIIYWMGGMAAAGIALGLISKVRF